MPPMLILGGGGTWPESARRCKSTCDTVAHMTGGLMAAGGAAPVRKLIAGFGPLSQPTSTPTAAPTLDAASAAKAPAAEEGVAVTPPRLPHCRRLNAVWHCRRHSVVEGAGQPVVSCHTKNACLPAMCRLCTDLPAGRGDGVHAWRWPSALLRI
jgi:hypothetical protein